MGDILRPRPEDIKPPKKRVGKFGAAVAAAGIMLGGDKAGDRPVFAQDQQSSMKSSGESDKPRVTETHGKIVTAKDIGQEELNRKAADIFEGADILDEKDDGKK